MFAFLKPKTPIEILLKTLQDLHDIPAGKKMAYYQKHKSAINNALTLLPVEPIAHLASLNDKAETGVALSHSSAVQRLPWSHSILRYLDDAPYLTFNSSRLNGAAACFFSDNQERLRKDFADIFRLNPFEAFKAVKPAALYREELTDALRKLATDNTPATYLACLDAIDFDDDKADKKQFRKDMDALTAPVLKRLLQEDPQKFLFEHSKRGIFAGYDHYPLDYLGNDWALQQEFIQENMDSIVNGLTNISGEIEGKHMNGLKHLCRAYNGQELPEKLVEVTKIYAAKHARQCFNIAANTSQDIYPSIKNIKQLAQLGATPSPLLVGMTPSDSAMYPSVHTIYRVTNQDAPADQPDENRGTDSKYLWVLCEGGKTIAASFAAASLRTYLECQRERFEDEMPTPEDLDSFVEQLQPKP